MCFYKSIYYFSMGRTMKKNKLLDYCIIFFFFLILVESSLVQFVSLFLETNMKKKHFWISMDCKPFFSLYIFEWNLYRHRKLFNIVRHVWIYNSNYLFLVYFDYCNILNLEWKREWIEIIFEFRMKTWMNRDHIRKYS